jgi:light-regulated signal transduction histidine kinase (bacteriophytochrome)
MIYQFDEAYNGQVVEDIIDTNQPLDTYLTLVWPASDIPAQARELYRLTKIRFVYDVDDPTARMCCRSLAEVDNPLNMAHTYLRAMSPIHCHYLKQMDVKSSMSSESSCSCWGIKSLR